MFCKMINGIYISGVCTSDVVIGVEIAESEYNTIIDVIHNRPAAPDGYGYRLHEDLTWELYELPAIEETEEELTDQEAYNIIMGVSE